ncbi:hypothetical protein QN345_20005, partial [Cryobacterium sp. 10I1]|uniref:hypothetical protein n=1 Tax=Cryobacterium sp. 10I1 TaxID=3048578 RepID=UPI002B225473
GGGAAPAVHHDDRLPLGRVVVLAHGGTSGRGYAALCRAVSAAHQAMSTGTGREPSIGRSELAELAGLRALTVLLGPVSDVGEAIGRRATKEAGARLTAWQGSMPTGSV